MVMLGWCPSHWHSLQVVLAFVMRVWRSSCSCGIHCVGVAFVCAGSAGMLAFIVQVWHSLYGCGIRYAGVAFIVCVMWVWRSLCMSCGCGIHPCRCGVHRVGVAFIRVGVAFIVWVWHSSVWVWHPSCWYSTWVMRVWGGYGVHVRHVGLAFIALGFITLGFIMGCAGVCHAFCCCAGAVFIVLVLPLCCCSSYHCQYNALFYRALVIFLTCTAHTCHFFADNKKKPKKNHPRW